MSNVIYQNCIDDVLQRARNEGCIVRVYNKKRFKDCIGCFHSGSKIGTICVAGDYEDKKYLFYVVVHEYQHFRQWIEGYENFKEYGKTLNERLRVEYDAEKRTARFIQRNYKGVGFNRLKYIRFANRYMQMLKWSAYTKKWIYRSSSMKYLKVPSRWFTDEELYASLTDNHIDMMYKYYKQEQKKDKKRK